MLLLPDTLTMNEARDALRMLSTSLQRDDSGGELMVDASALKRFDSSAIAVLLESARLANARGKRLKVRGAPEQMADLARLYGVAELLL